MRSACLVLGLLFAPLLAGCFGDEPATPLAQPTASTPFPPRVSTPRAPTTAYNFSDPGFRMTEPWRTGDGWDYESNQSHYRRVRVVDARLANGTQYYVVEERTGTIGASPDRVTTSWVDGRQWMQLNATDDKGTRDTYTPGIALRSFKNGSFVYNHTHVGAAGASVLQNVLVQTRLAAQHTTILFPWGYVEAKRIDVTTTTRDPRTNATTTVTTQRWVHGDHLNDVQYTTAQGELFKVTAVKAGDHRRGQLAS